MKSYSRSTLILTAVVSASAALFFACSFDWNTKTQAVDSSPVYTSTSNKAVIAGLPALSDIVKHVKPAVVNISSRKVVRPNAGVYRQDPFFGRYFGLPQEQPQNSLGSGFIINKDGTILTNNHVVQNADEIDVKLSDGRKFVAKVIGTDPKTDIAVIRIQGGNGDFPIVPLGDSNNLEVGEWVVAVGNPFGLGQTVTAGIVSAKGRVIGAGPYDDFIQTDASINPGNSGGPLFNLNGDVVGINTAIIASGQGIGFAIPISMAKSTVDQLLQNGKVSRGYLGVGIQDVTADLAKSFGLNSEKGALIASVYPGGPAEKAGIEAGDIILNFNGKNLETSHDLPLFVSQTPVGTNVMVEVLRKGGKKTLQVQVGELEKAERELAQAEKVSSELGLAVQELLPQQAEQLGLKERKGVMVVKVIPGSQADWVGIRPGDVILEVNNTRVDNLGEYSAAIQKIKFSELVRMFVKRGNLTSYFAFRK